mgnify:CR=1 FL=1
MVLEKTSRFEGADHFFPVLLRTVLAMVFSGILGYERENERASGRISDVYGCLYRLGNCDDDGNFSEPGAWKH